MQGRQTDWTKYTAVGDLYVNLDYYYERIEQAGADECWPWTGPQHRQGYGMMGAFDENQKRKMTVTHRVTARLKFGAITSKDFVVHTCSNPLCQNPAHIILGNASVRNNVMIANGRNAKTRVRKQLHQPQAGRKYKYDPDEMIWIRNHTTEEIAERFGLTKQRASALRYGIRTGFRWLDNYKA